MSLPWGAQELGFTLLSIYTPWWAYCRITWESTICKDPQGFISTSGFSWELQTHISNCPISTSTWLSTRHFKFNVPTLHLKLNSSCLPKTCSSCNPTCHWLHPQSSYFSEPTKLKVKPFFNFFPFYTQNLNVSYYVPCVHPDLSHRHPSSASLQ